MREMCRRCRRPASVCYCAALACIDTRTRVVILQHPRERDMPIGTARMASLCLPNAALHVGVRWSDPAILGDNPILLYPGKGARDILREPPAGPVTLVVIDGTWSQAKTVVRDNPMLHALPRYAFSAPEPSRYRIRREPSAEYCSTIEALMHVLGVLEGDPAKFRALLAPLRLMVDNQLACQARSPCARVRKPRAPRPPRRLVPAERVADVVCVVAEANAWPCRSPDRQPDELVHLVAERVATGEIFDQIAAPERPLSPSTPFHTELAEARLRGGVARGDALAAFARFVRPTDIAAGWGHYGLDLVRASGGALPERLDVRAGVQAIVQGKIEGLEDYAGVREGGDGRANRRLAMLVDVVRRHTV